MLSIVGIFTWPGSLVACLVCVFAFSSLQAQDDPVKLMVFGDSLTAGYGLSGEEGFVSQLQQALVTKGYGVKVVNASQSGDSTLNGLERLEWSLLDRPDAFILELGGNDSLRGFPVSDTDKNLRQIILRVQREEIPILLAGMLASPSMGTSYKRAFDSIYPRLAREYDLLFYPFFLEEVAAKPAYNQRDGIHPNAQGIALIVDDIMPEVEKLLKHVKS